MIVTKTGILVILSLQSESVEICTPRERKIYEVVISAGWYSKVSYIGICRKKGLTAYR